jgi:hypothetical protein
VIALKELEFIEELEKIIYWYKYININNFKHMRSKLNEFKQQFMPKPHFSNHTLLIIIDEERTLV